MDFALEILQDFAITTNFNRFAAGSYNAEGIYTNGATTNFPILITIQPLTDQEMLSLTPEGRRTRRYVKGYTNIQLRIADQVTNTQADRVAFDGTFFEVERVEKWVWPEGDFNYWKVIMAGVNP